MEISVLENVSIEDIDNVMNDLKSRNPISLQKEADYNNNVYRVVVVFDDTGSINEDMLGHD